MSASDGLVLQEQRHLKWRALDPLEYALMVLCGVAITGFCVLVMCDVVTRTIGHPWLWLQEATMTFFIYGIFIGRGRGDPPQRSSLSRRAGGIDEPATGGFSLRLFNRSVVLAVALCMIWFGYLNVLDGFTSLRMPSMTPLATYYAAIPLSGILVALFTVEQMVNGWRNGFAETSDADERRMSL